MVLAVLIFLNALLSVNASPHKAPCVDKAAGDPCEYGSSGRGRGVCCTTILNEAGMRQKFCRSCDWPGATTHGECTLRVSDKYLGCFRRAEDSLVFQTCHGVASGSSCVYETAASTWRKPPTPAYNTTGVCLPHIYHQGVMCLEAVGDENADECNGKEVGQPCTHSELANAICTHDPRRGTWMCSAPKTEEPVFAVCEGMEQGTPCSYTAKIDPRFDNGLDSGLIQGACDLHEQLKEHDVDLNDGHALMCLASDDLQDEASTASAPNDDEEEDEGSPVILIIAIAAVSLLVGCISGVIGVRVMQPPMQKKPTTASQPDGISYPPQMIPADGDAHPSSQQSGNGEKL